MLLLQCIICGTDNGLGEGFNDFPYRNKFVIYIRILEGNEKSEARLCCRVFSPLSGAHVNGLLMSPYVLYRFTFKFSYCVYMYNMLLYGMYFPQCHHYCSTEHPVRRPDIENCIQLLRSRRDFFNKQFVNIFILLR